MSDESPAVVAAARVKAKIAAHRSDWQRGVAYAADVCRGHMGEWCCADAKRALLWASETLLVIASKPERDDAA